MVLGDIAMMHFFTHPSKTQKTYLNSATTDQFDSSAHAGATSS